MNDITSYREEIKKDITECLEDLKVPPILFFGSGISQRYIGLPSWDGLLSYLANNIDTAKDLAFYKQQGKSHPEIGTILSTLYRDQAWEDKTQYSEEFFHANAPKDIYIKHQISSYIKKLTENDCIEENDYADEIKSLLNIKPYSIITTNYDTLIEKIFPSYIPIVGYETLRVNFNSIGEIYKIHGSVENPDSIIFTQDDYEEFQKKGKYISAKLLTFFSEHPLFIIGYSAQDENIVSILSDIDEILSPANELVKNIYIVEYTSKIDNNTNFSREKIISLNGKEFRIKRIVANNFKWIFDILGSRNPIENVSIKMLRSISSRVYKMVRSDIPSGKINVDFETLKKTDSEEGMATFFGLLDFSDNPKGNMLHPFTISEVSEKLGFGYNGWNKVNTIINKIKIREGYNIKESDNRYHNTLTTGRKSVTHKYSNDAIELFKKFTKGETYEFNP